MRIAFLTLDAYDSLTGGQRGNVGGAELQQVLIGRELSDRGHDVAFIENDAPYKEEKTVDGIEVVLKRGYAEYPFVQRQPARAVSTLNALRTVDPDICYLRGPNVDALSIALYCGLTDSRFVYGFAHDRELAAEQNVFENAGATNDVFRGLLRSTIGRADVVVVQNEFQHQRAKRLFDTDIELIENGYPKPNVSAPKAELRTDRPVVFWAATLREWKQPEVVLDMAAEVPDAEFVLAGSRADESPELYDEIEARARDVENLTFTGYIPYEDIDEYFARADVFLNTSTSEGFPNTFLQAWAHETPVVSLNVDPNDILRNHDIGHHADGDLERLVSSLRDLTDDAERRKQVGENAREYFAENHSIDVTATDYENAFRPR